MKLRRNSVSRVLKGGCFSLKAHYARVNNRIMDGTEYRDRYSGFRFVVRGNK